MTIKPGDGMLADRVVAFSFAEFGLKNPSLLGGRIYITAKILRQPTRAELRGLRKMLDNLSASMYCQIDINKIENIKFAAFFGFQPVKQIDKRLEMELN